MARTSAWIVSLVLQLGVLSYGLHRAGIMPTGLAIALFFTAVAGAALALLLAMITLLQVWRRGGERAATAGGAAVASMLILGAATAALIIGLRTPPVNDVSTDLTDPPRFDIIKSRRPADANSTEYAGGASAALQRVTWPDIAAIETRRSATESYSIVMNVADRLNWRVVAAGAPGEGGPLGEIEAIDRTLIMGFTDDIAVRIVPIGEIGSRIDVRSASRYGTHDYGRNAERVRLFLREVRTAIEASELTTAG